LLQNYSFTSNQSFHPFKIEVFDQINHFTAADLMLVMLDRFICSKCTGFKECVARKEQAASSVQI
jgi:hypothetical protein